MRKSSILNFKLAALMKEVRPIRLARDDIILLCSKTYHLKELAKYKDEMLQIFKVEPLIFSSEEEFRVYVSSNDRLVGHAVDCLGARVVVPRMV